MSVNTYPVPLYSSALLKPEDVLLALRQWHKESPNESRLAELSLFQSRQRATGASARHTANSILRHAMKQLAAESAENATLLRDRFLDRKTAFEVANDLNIAESTLYIRQKEAVSRLTDIILSHENDERTKRCERLLQNLELQPDEHLIGIERNLKELVPKLSDANGQMVIAIEGIGGIGKTTLADALVRSVLQADLSWEQIAWVSARQTELLMSGTIGAVNGEGDRPALTVEALIEQLYEQLLPENPRPASFSSEQVFAALKQHLSEHKCLVIIDNLETIADVESLLPTLRELTNPTKFILTSRESLYAERDIFHYQTPELDEADSLALVRREALSSNLPHVAEAKDEELQPIYTTVGGNPLALRLVTGQLHIHGLSEILDDLTEARTETAENLYTFIYWRAWECLPEPARRALIAMILVTDYGDTIEELLETCDLERGELRDALMQLVTLNLVESRGGLNERRYTIHNLTRSFLHKQVVMWSYN